MIEFSTIESLIMTYAPLVVTILGIVVAFLKMIANIKQIREDNKLSNEEKDKEITQLKAEMSGLLQQNYELQKTLKELLTKIDKVKRE